MGWTIELGEFQGGLRIYRKEDESDCYYEKHFTFLKVSGMWQPSENHEPIEVCRLTVSQDGREVIGAQVLEDLNFAVSLEFHWHREPRRLEGLFFDEDLFHIDDDLSVVRSNAIPSLGADEPLDLKRPCINWTGTIGNVTVSPIMIEALRADACPLYDIPRPQQDIRVRMLGPDGE